MVDSGSTLSFYFALWYMYSFQSECAVYYVSLIWWWIQKSTVDKLEPEWSENIVREWNNLLYSTLDIFTISDCSVIWWLYCEAHHSSNYSNWPGLQVFKGFYSYLTLESFTKFTQRVADKLLQWRYLAWNKPLITLVRVMWLDISLSGFLFQPHKNKLACSWNILPYQTLTHVISIIHHLARVQKF